MPRSSQVQAARAGVLAAVILSAGESSRMGSPKALVPFRGRTFLEHLLEASRGSQEQANSQSPTQGISTHATIPPRSKVPDTEHRIGLTRVVLGAKADVISAQLVIDT